MNNYFVILAAGKSKRFHKKIAKQFYNYKNKEIIDHSIEKSVNSKLFKKILVVTNNINHCNKIVTLLPIYLNVYHVFLLFMPMWPVLILIKL